MKFNSSIIIVLLAALLLCGANAHAQKSKGHQNAISQEETPQGSEASTATTENVNITVTTASGRIIVHGWERNELRARSEAGMKIELRKAGGMDAASPAMRVEVLVYDRAEEGEETDYNACNSDADVRLDVPRGATVYLKTQEGDIEVEGVAEAHLETTDGRIEARNITKVTDAASVGGNISLEDARGRAHLNSLSGIIEVRNLRPLDGSDFLKIKTVSGDILLDEIGPARVEASTISGDMKIVGALAHGGIYDFTTTSSDVTLLMPAESSFKLNAKVSESGEIITEFPLKYRGSASPVSLLQAGRLLGTYGSGDATINLVSYSGTLRLRKQ